MQLNPSLKNLNLGTDMVKVRPDIKKAEDKCRKQGVQLTSKRKLVLTVLLQVDKAVSAYELIELCERDFKQTLPAMSVYRILDFLESVQLVHRLNIANKYVSCSNISDDQPHPFTQFLLCNECNKVDEVELDSSTFDEVDSKVKQTGYQLLSPQIELNCICNTCCHELAPANLNTAS